MFALLVQLAPVLAKLRQLREKYDQIDGQLIRKIFLQNQPICVKKITTNNLQFTQKTG